MTKRELDLTAAVAVAAKPKPKPRLSPRQHDAHLRALASLKRWETKLQRAVNAVNKYRRKVRSYERKAGNA